MTRDLPTDLATAFGLGGSVPGNVALMVEFRFDSGTLGMWTGFGNFTYNGVVYAGGGNLTAISAYEETLDLQAKGLTFSLSGVDSELIEVSENEPYQGRVCKLYIAMMSAPGVVDDIYPIFSGIMDVMDTQDDPTNSIIQLSVENVLTLLKRSKTRRYTDQDQKSRYPDDDGLSFIVHLMDVEIIW